ncbi:MAG: hypothetical protein ACRCWI_01300 [Brevinema sp.]
MYYFVFIFLLSTSITAKDMAIESNPFFSNSIVIIKGENSLAFPSTDDKVKGLPASIDWSKIPDLGLPKEEIHTIKIMGRQHLSYQTNVIDLLPDVWIFIADKWTLEYHGQILYLENLEFLPEETDLKINNQILVKQNDLGYYQDESTSYPGFYQHINAPMDDSIRYLYLVSAEDNQYIYNMERLLDVQIIKDQLLQNQENSIEITLEPQTNLAIDLETMIDGEVIDHTVIPNTNTTETEQSIIDRSINTSIDKKKKLNE